MVQATIRSHELKALARGRLGLILGPDVTTSTPNFFFRLGKDLADAFGLEHRGTFYEVGERAVQDGNDVEAVRARIVAFAKQEQASPFLVQLAKVRWSAILSAAVDWQFETRLEGEHMRRPARQEVVVVTDPTHIPRDGTLPVFKLLGSALRSDVIATTPDFLKRSPFLSDITRLFVKEYVKGSPILCAGFAGAPWLLEPLLAHLFGHLRVRPAKVVLLADDPVTENDRIYSLVPPGALAIAEGSVIDVARAIEPTTANRQLNLPMAAAAGTGAATFEVDGDVFAALWPGMVPTIEAHERERLLDFLFMPDVPNWEAFLHKMDFARSLTAIMAKEILGRVEHGDGHALFLMHGRAASGKTTVLKRLALELAVAGQAPLWARDYWHADASDRFNDTFRRWGQLKSKQPLVLFVDDPGKIREFSLPALLDMADRHGVRLLVVASVRTSVFALYNRASIVGDRKSEYLTYDLDDELDTEEWKALPQYLLDLGMYPDLEASKLAVRAAQGAARTQDTLALLYWLLPKTRQHIEHSIQTEYVSLGDSRGLHAIVIGSMQHSSKMLQDAYGMVAVASKYGVALPIEILVAALGVGSYAEWLEAIDTTGPAWGLFYPQDDEDIEGSSYVPRNEVVTRTVLKLVNGGTLRFDGEVQIMRRLLAACDSSNYVYERFAERILVPYTKLRHLEYRDGLSLYRAAESALPFTSRSLSHHRGLWMKKMGHDLDGALKAYDEALAGSAGPQNPKLEQEEFVYTSRATALIDKMQSGQLSRDEGKQLVLAALEKSRSTRFINAHAVHVYAKLVSKVAFGYTSDDEVDRFELINKALAEVDRTLALLRSSKFRRTNAAESLEKLHDIRDKILVRCHSSSDSAQLLWDNFGSQVGFTIETRRLTAAGMSGRDRGLDFKEAFAYWSQAEATIRSKTAELSAEFAEAGLHLYYLWQIHPRTHHWQRTPRDPLKWKLVAQLAERVLSSARNSGDPFYRYLYAIALAHNGDWRNAHIVFEENRRLQLAGDMMQVPRNYLLHAEGNPWKLAGSVKHGASELYFDALDLKQAFIANRTEHWPRGEAVVHAYIVFSFAGPKATRSERACWDNT